MRSGPSLAFLRTFTVAAILAAISTPGVAATFPEAPSRDFFVDEAGLIAAPEGERINEIASALLREQRVSLVVATIQSLAGQDAAGMSIEAYAAALFDAWGIGFEDWNNGMLLLVSRGDRQARIELGEDWGGQYDSAARSVMDELIVPEFKSGRFSTGILDGVRGMEAMARGLGLPAPTRPWWLWPTVIAAVAGVVWLIVSLFRSGRRGWAWALIAALAALLFMLIRASGSSGQASDALGGGSSGGGGATGKW